MKLYYSKGSCSLAIRIILNEIGIKSEFESVDLKAKKTETGKDYFAINPKGSVPALVLDNGELLSENAVIQQYLADSNNASQLLPKVGDFSRYRVLEVLNFITTELHKGCVPLFNPAVPEEQKENIFKKNAIAKLSLISKQLGENKYLVLNHFTLADAYLFVVLSWLPRLKIDLASWKNLSAYFEELKQRKSVSQALKEEGIV